MIAINTNQIKPDVQYYPDIYHAKFHVFPLFALCLLLLLAGCGGGGSDGKASDVQDVALLSEPTVPPSEPTVPPSEPAVPPSENTTQLLAPLLNKKSTYVTFVIPEPDKDCDYKLYIDNQFSVKTIDLRKQVEYDIYDHSILNFYSYTCTKDNLESDRSRSAIEISFVRSDFDWGAISIADFNNDSFYELLGTYGSIDNPIPVSESDLGLADLRLSGRKYRDVRFADFNNDGKLDAIANVYTENDPNSQVQLYWGTSDGKFAIDSTFSAQNYSGYGETIVVADFNNDGYLDIFLPQYYTGNGPYSRNLLLKNNQDKTFSEISLQSGIAVGKSQRPEGAQALDYDLDGFIDIYSGGSLFRNLGSFQFQDVTTDVGLPGIFDEGIKFYDYNHDGYLDLLLHSPNSGPRLFQNDGKGKFNELTDIFPSDYFQWSYGLNVGDVNADGYDDILIGGGVGSDGVNRPPRLWLYYNGKYINQDFIENSGYWSDLVSFGDLDNNGSLDLILRYGNNVVLRNNIIPNNFIKITVLNDGFKNQQGRIVKANFINGKTKAMVVDGGSGYMSNQPYPSLVPNDSNELISFNVYCNNKILDFSANKGDYQVDCATSSITYK